MLKFAQALYSSNKYSYYTSDLANQELINLNNNPKVPTYRMIESALKNYKNSAETLQDYSEFMKVWDEIYGNAIKYLDGILSFDLSRYCINAYNPEKDYKSGEYLDDVKRVYKFFNKFNYKEEFKRIVSTMLVTGVCFAWMRDSEGTYNDEAISLDNDGYEVKKTQKFSLQLMPQKYCKITGKFPEGFLWDFNLNYFNTPNVNINNYDPSLKKALNDKKENGEMKSYIAGDNGLNKSNGYGDDGWTRTKVNDGAWCFKFDDSNFNILPPLGSLMKTVFNNDVIAKLQLDKDIASAYALLVGEMKTLKDQGAKQKDPFTINPNTLGSLLHLIQSGLKRNVRPIALPLEETKFMQFNDNCPNMALNQYRTSASNSVSASSMIFSDGKMGQFEAQMAYITDYNFMKKLYSQFENFLNFFVNKKTKKYKFKFVLNGSQQPFEREYRINNLNKLLDKGLTPNVSEIASTYGYGIQQFECMLQEARYGGITELTTMLMNANTMSSKDIPSNSSKSKETEQIGRPKESENNLTQSGENSRYYG